ncbi:MAG: hypothetical protein J5978_05845 [Spirochaetaceae bacterium]|nr:hypothetical protein [Spirochaetaceae bacterium]
MKKAFLILFCILAIFTACKQAPIFYDISQEIELSDPTIKGKVISMKRLGTDESFTIYAANQELNVKAASEQRWEKVSGVPGSKVVSLACSKDYLYIGTNPAANETITVYCHKVTENGTLDSESSWKEVASGVSRLFDNQAFGSNAKAYFVKNVETGDGENKTTTPTVFALSGESEPTEQSNAKSVFGNPIITAVHLGGTDYFVGAPAVAMDNYVYVADGATIKYANQTVLEDILAKTEGAKFEETSETDSTITSLSVNGLNLYAGTTEGFEVASVDNTYAGKLKSFENPGNNAESAFGTREVLGIWNFDNKDNFFVSVTSFLSSSYDALWGFNTSNSKWNIE